MKAAEDQCDEQNQPRVAATCLTKCVEMRFTRGAARVRQESQI